MNKMTVSNLKKVFVIFLAFVSQSKSQIPSDIKTQVDNLIEELLVEENVPALGLSIIRNNGEILYTTGYGFRDVENKVPADDSTIFGIGSISKSFTAILVVKELTARFPELGESVLDVPIRKLVPSYNFTLGDRYRSESASFRDLLAHTTCLLPESFGLFTGPFENANDFAYRQRYAPEVCSFRSNFVYNNGIVALAGEIIAHVANSTFEEMLSELLKEIGMNETTFVKKSDDHNNMQGRSFPYYQKDGKLHRLNPKLLNAVTMAIGSGGILSSARDMATYMQFHLNYGKVGSVQIIPEASMRWLRRPSNLLVSGSFKGSESDVIDTFYGYGLCLFLGVYDGWQTVSHSGNLPPYESLMTLTPELNLGIFTTISGPGVLTKFPQHVLHNRIFDILQGNNRSLSDQKSQESTNSLWKEQRIGLDFQNPTQLKRQSTNFSVKVEPVDVVGTFGSPMSGQLEGSLKMNSSGVLQPYVSYGEWGQGWLTQTFNTTFQVEWDSDIKQLFEGSLAGDSDSIITLEFVDLNTIQLTENGMPSGTDFIRNLTIGQVPAVPWSSDSCGPESF